MPTSWLIVGAGLTGATVARCLAEDGSKVTVLDQREHVAGNAHDPVHPSGIRIHAHGPHAFHTNSEKVVRFLSRFTEWHPYEHRVRGRIDGVEIPIPFNLTGIRTFYPNEEVNLLTRIRADNANAENVSIAKLLENPSPAVREFGRFVFERVFVGYTRKQWGMEPEELGPQVLSRVPVRLSLDDRYFQDRFQAIPRDGYTSMVERMLSHPRIRIELGYRATIDGLQSHDRVIYTGAVDQLLGSPDGHLPYRSLRFNFTIHDQEFVLPSAQMNFPQDHEFTRISEFKHMTGQRNRRTVTATEYPEAYVPGSNTPYYPIDTPPSRIQHKKYLEKLRRVHPGILALGRLADFRYYNMDQAVARALQIAAGITK